MPLAPPQGSNMPSQLGRPKHSVGIRWPPCGAARLRAAGSLFLFQLPASTVAILLLVAHPAPRCRPREVGGREAPGLQRPNRAP
eukprot:1580978-Pyramimonas_sp.AAC.1